MQIDIVTLINEIQVKQDKQIEQDLKIWVRLHPGARYFHDGYRIPKRRRKEARTWFVKWNALLRGRRRIVMEEVFMRQWKAGLGKDSDVAMFYDPVGITRKRNAKRRARIKMRRLRV